MAKFFLPSSKTLKKLKTLISVPSCWLGDIGFEIGGVYYYIDDYCDVESCPKAYIKNRKLGIRAATKYSQIKDKCKNLRVVNGKLLADYGEIPFTEKENCVITDEDIRKELETMYRSNCMLTTGKVYKENNKEYKEYYYKNQKYIRKIIIDKGKASYNWYYVKPITWIIDENLNIAVTIDSIHKATRKEALKYLKTLDEVIYTSNLDNLQKDNIMIPIKNSDLNDVEEYRQQKEDEKWQSTTYILIHNIINSIPIYSKDADFVYLKEVYSLYSNKYNISLAQYMDGLSKLQEKLNTYKKEFSTEHIMLDYINEWIYVLETDIHNVKYDNIITNRILSLKKNIKFNKERRLEFKTTLLGYKNDLINKMKLHHDIDINNLTELERKVSEFIKENYRELYIESKEKEAVKEDNNVSVNTKSAEVQSIIDEIVSLLEDYPEKEKIEKEIEKCLAEYTKAINKEVPKGLSLEHVDKKMIYATLIHELSSIRDELRLFSKENKKYLDMLNLIDEWKNGLNFNQLHEGTNSIAKNFNLLQDTVFPYLDTTSRGALYYQKLVNLLDDEEEKIHEFIKQKNTNGYKDIEDFEYQFRIKYENYLLELNKEIRNSGLINDIRDSYNSLLNNDIVNANNKYIEELLTSLNDVFRYIEIYGSDDKGENSKIEKAKAIIEKPIDYTTDIISILNDIKTRFILLSKIKLEIEERIIKENENKSFDLDVIIKKSVDN